MFKEVQYELQNFKVEPPQGPVPWDKLTAKVINKIKQYIDDTISLPISAENKLEEIQRLFKENPNEPN